MDSKMQPGRFTLRFNMNDPQQQMAVDILNRLGRQKAQYLAQALIHYAECREAAPLTAPVEIDERVLEQAILSVLSKHPQFMRSSGTDEADREAANQQETASLDDPAPIWDEFINDNSLEAINKTLAAFRRQ